jgi:8-oxo-dGTP diphosphatase
MKTVHVAVAVIENDNGDVLIAKRPDHLHMGGFWEFPGGKVEEGEIVLQALQREICEEVALEIHSAEPLLQIPFQYPGKRVLLDVWRVTHFSGAALGCEGQKILWVPRAELCKYEFPSANRAILTALQMPERLLVTGKFANTEECLQRTRNALEKHGIRAVILRAHELTPVAYKQLAEEMLQLCQQYDALLLLNTEAEFFRDQADGLHLSSQRLMSCQQRPVSQEILFGASCHNPMEIEQALALRVDYVLLSPVLPTATHPDAEVLGWSGLAQLLAACPVPAYALGGLQDQHAARIKSSGAFGMAGISAWW